jgi:hypothetical protein
MKKFTIGFGIFTILFCGSLSAYGFIYLSWILGVISTLITAFDVFVFYCYITKNKLKSWTDDELLQKAKTLIGQKATINGACGDIETVTIVKVVGITEELGYKEVRFITSDSFYRFICIKAETIMKWKYSK